MKIVEIAMGAAFCVLTACSNNNERGIHTQAEEGGASMEETVASGGVTSEGAVDNTNEPGVPDWTAKDNLPEVSLSEFEGSDVKLYEADGYSVYSVAKEALFSAGSVGLKSDAEQSLRIISSALASRNKEGLIRIYGYMDVSENPNYKRDVAERRVQAIKDWLQKKGNIDGTRIAVQPVVEVTASSDEGAEARNEQRIEIVVRNKNS